MNGRPERPHRASAWLRRGAVLATALTVLVAPVFMIPAQAQAIQPVAPGDQVTPAGLEEPRREPLHPALLAAAALLMVGVAVVGLRITLRGWRDEERRRRHRHRHRRAGSQ